MLRRCAVLLTFATLGCGGEDSGNPTAPPVAAPVPQPTATPTSAPAPPPPAVASGCSGQVQPAASSSSATVTSARIWGGGAADSMEAVTISSNCTVYAGGRITGFSGPARSLTAGTAADASGLLVRLAPNGTDVLGAVRFGTVISDVDLRNASGELALASDTGLALLSPDLAQTRWLVEGRFTRVAIDRDGTVAALGGGDGKRLSVYSPAGALLFTRSWRDSMVNDVAIAGEGANLRIAVTGMAQRDGGGCTQLQVAWIRAFDASGAAAWSGYDWSHAQAFNRSSSCADTRGYRLAAGADGKLYFAGESAGGNSIFRYAPLDLAEAAPNVATDAHNNAYNTASNHITYVARLNGQTGQIEAGSFVLARLSNSRGNTIKPRALAADAAGNVYLGGVSAASIANRKAISLNEATLADYAGGDPWLMVLGADFRTRKAFLAFADGGQGELLGVAVGGGAVALSARIDAANAATGKSLFVDAPAGTFSGPKAGWLGVLPGWR